MQSAVLFSTWTRIKDWRLGASYLLENIITLDFEHAVTQHTLYDVISKYLRRTLHSGLLYWSI